MKIGNISNNTSFGKIYAVVGDKKNMSKLRIFVADEKKTSNNPAMVYNLTNHPSIPTSIANKLEDKQQLCVVVTGEESLKSTNNLVGKELSSFLLTSADKFIKLSSNIKRDAVEILQSIKHNK
ncbi:MAG: hypothetical protein IJY61_07860 [Candidatus Gastranaerophilales bacterium]|nr:hypothetical protein [Candidatus Gastranaerophilales bacterium]